MIIGSTAVGARTGIGDSYVVATKTYSITSLLNSGIGGYGMGMKVKYSPVLTYDADFLALACPTSALNITARFLRPIAELFMDCRFILSPLSRIPTDSIINTLFWSWATVLDQSYRRILQATQANDLHNAQTTDLDAIGQIYHTARLLGEADEHYRLRLITQTSVLIGCGTTTNTEAVINQILGVTTGTDVVTGPPGSVRITFNTHDAAVSAVVLQATINNVLPDLFAAGILYTLYLPITQYTVDYVSSGTGEMPYTVTAQAAVRYIQTADFDISCASMATKTYTMDELTQFRWTKQLGMSMAHWRKAFAVSAVFDVFSILRIPLPYTMTEQVRATYTKTFTMTKQCMKTWTKYYTPNMLAQKARGLEFGMALNVAS
jgi:hypothetical protein